MSKADPHCPKCGGGMDRGELRITHIPPLLSGIRLEMILPGVKTSPNPLKAFQQGLADAPDDLLYDLTRAECHRCRSCGYLELYAPEESSHRETPHV